MITVSSFLDYTELCSSFHFSAPSTHLAQVTSSCPWCLPYLLFCPRCTKIKTECLSQVIRGLETKGPMDLGLTEHLPHSITKPIYPRLSLPPQTYKCHYALHTSASPTASSTANSKCLRYAFLHSCKASHSSLRNEDISQLCNKLIWDSIEQWNIKTLIA